MQLDPLPKSAVAEIVIFSLKTGISDSDFVALSQQSQDFVQSAPGFLFRTLSKGSDGKWCDFVIWNDMIAAKATADTFPQQPFAPALMAAIDGDTLSLRHAHIHWSLLPRT